MLYLLILADEKEKSIVIMELKIPIMGIKI
jgi:hypothetical protein